MQCAKYHSLSRWSCCEWPCRYTSHIIVFIIIILVWVPLLSDFFLTEFCIGSRYNFFQGLCLSCRARPSTYPWSNCGNSAVGNRMGYSYYVSHRLWLLCRYLWASCIQNLLGDSRCARTHSPRISFFLPRVSALAGIQRTVGRLSRHFSSPACKR